MNSEGEKKMNMEFIGLAAGILKTVSFAPQLIKTIVTKKAQDDISTFTPFPLKY
jgi:uncharacterized protein with PQ loop repeat